MTHPNANTPGFVGSVDKILWATEAHRKFTERVIGSGRHDLWQRVALPDMFSAYRFRHCPRGLFDFLGNACRTLWRSPAFAANAYRVSDDFRGLSRFRLREIKEPHGCKIQHQSFSLLSRKNELCGKDHFCILTGQPGVDAGISRDNFLVSEVVTASNIEQGVFMAGSGDLNISDNIHAFRREQKPVTGRRNV